MNDPPDDGEKGDGIEAINEGNGDGSEENEFDSEDADTEEGDAAYAWAGTR